MRGKKRRLHRSGDLSMKDIRTTIIRLLGGFTKSDVESVAVISFKSGKQSGIDEGKASVTPYQDFAITIQADDDYTPTESGKMSRDEILKWVHHYFPDCPSDSSFCDDPFLYRVDTDMISEKWWISSIASLNPNDYFNCEGFASLAYSCFTLCSGGKLAVAEAVGYTDWFGQPDGCHAFNVFIGKDGKPVYFEPQTGDFFNHGEQNVKVVRIRF